jgi:hypothetical protein
MPQDVRVGTILMSEWPQLFGLESEPYSGHWSVVKALDGFVSERKISGRGMEFLFIASEVKVMFLARLGRRRSSTRCVGF